MTLTLNSSLTGVCHLSDPAPHRCEQCVWRYVAALWLGLTIRQEFKVYRLSTWSTLFGPIMEKTLSDETCSMAIKGKCPHLCLEFLGSCSFHPGALTFLDTEPRGKKVKRLQQKTSKFWSCHQVLSAPMSRFKADPKRADHARQSKNFETWRHHQRNLTITEKCKPPICSIKKYGTNFTMAYVNLWAVTVARGCQNPESYVSCSITCSFLLQQRVSFSPSGIIPVTQEDILVLTSLDSSYI